MFVQGKEGPGIACMFPDVVNDDCYPCPGTPAIADNRPAVGVLTVYAVNTLLMKRSRTWNYRRASPSDTGLDDGSMISPQETCE